MEMLPNKESHWFKELKEDRLKLKNEIDPVSRRSEYWRKSNLEILESDLDLNTLPKDSQADSVSIEKPSIIVTGKEVLDNRPKGVKNVGLEAFQLKNVISDEESEFKKYIGTIEKKSQKLIPRPLALENALNASNGIILKAKGLIKDPVYIENQIDISEENKFLRNFVKLENGSSLTIVETGSKSFTKNMMSEFYISKGAKLNYINLTNFYNKNPKIDHVFCDLEEGAVFNYFSLNLNPKSSRSEIEVHMSGKSSSVSISNICFINKDNHSNDENILINHLAPDCVSRQVLKSVLAGDCNSLVRGKIFVDAKAQKTDGYQSSRSLLLDNDAKFYCKPELEIYADDVACSHGSTSGSLDQESLFYLLSRGVSKQESEQILIMAFISEALEEIENTDIRETVRGVFSERVKRSSNE